MVDVFRNVWSVNVIAKIEVLRIKDDGRSTICGNIEVNCIRISADLILFNLEVVKGLEVSAPSAILEEVKDSNVGV